MNGGLEPMRVLLLSASSQIGGGNSSLLTLTLELMTRGVTCSIAVPGEGPMSRRCREWQVPLDVVDDTDPDWRHPFSTLSSRRRWKRVLQARAPQIVHANEMQPGRRVSLALGQLPLVCHVRFPPTEEYTRWVFRRMPVKPSAFIFNSRWLMGEVGATIARACPSARLAVIWNGVDLSAFRPGHGFISKHPRIGILANLTPVKGHSDFIQMGRILRDRGISAEFLIAGDDIYKTGFGDELRRQVLASEMGREVTFLGTVADVPPFLQSLDVLVCPSLVEPFGRCVAEAMVCGTAVVATRVGGLPELIEDGRTGILVNASSPEELADAVQNLLRDPNRRREIAEAGREWAVANLSQTTHADRVLEVYRSVLRGAQERSHVGGE